jgi:hypothetical protein
MLSGECETPANRAIKQEKSITRLPVYTLDPVYCHTRVNNFCDIVDWSVFLNQCPTAVIYFGKKRF